MYTADFPLVPVTVPGLRRMKQESNRISMLTAYDASFAACMDAVGVDVVLVGDSLGMVIQGHSSTLPVTVEQMVYHTSAVSRGLKRALLLADMPYQSYATPERALDTARQLIAQGGAAMVKLEGAGPIVDCIRFLVERDISVCAHLGLTPQSVHRMGGYRVQGRDARVADQLRRDAAAVVEAGAEMLVLECVPRQLAAEITASVPIPVIGIGAGAQCDGQVLVMHDALGVTQGKRPRFVRNFLVDGVDIAGAFAAYVSAVRSGEFPADSHGFS